MAKLAPAGRPKTNGGHTGHRPKSVPPTELTDGRRTVESEVNGDRKSLLLELTFKLGREGRGGARAADSSALFLFTAA